MKASVFVFRLTSHLTQAGEHSAGHEALQQETGQSDAYNGDTDLGNMDKDTESSANIKGFVAEHQSKASSPVAAIGVSFSVLVVVVAVVVVVFFVWRRARYNQSESARDTLDEYDVEQSQEDVSSQQTAHQEE